VAASDSRGTIAEEEGLDLAALVALKAEGRPLHDHPRGRKLGLEAVIDVPCDIWIPAVRPDVVHAGNVARLQTRLVAEGANIPLSAEAEQAPAARGVLVLPDFIVRRSNITVEPRPRLSLSSRKRSAPTPRPCSMRCSASGKSPRTAAETLAAKRVRRAMRTRRWDMPVG
jgi:glutamate dehydrogenase (NAD(P)+)